MTLTGSTQDKVVSPDTTVADARRAEIDHLTGHGKTDPYPKAIGLPGSSAKFAPDGSLLTFPGNTFICHLEKESREVAAIADLQRGLREGPAGEFFTYLPPSSFHMTVFPAICGDPLGLDGWPQNIEPGTGLEEINAIYQERLSGRTAFSKTRIRPREMTLGFSLEVEGVTDADRENIWAARRMFEEVTGLIRPDFESYRLHISIAYQRAWMSRDMAMTHLLFSDQLLENSREAIGEIEIGPIEFCTFQDMHEFTPLLVVEGS